MNRTLVLLTSLLTTNVFAAESQSRFINEIIVTAQKVEEDVQDTALPITALDEETIEDFVLTGPEDLAIHIPSFSRTEYDFTIRGVGRNFRALGGDPGVGTYINGMYVEDAFISGSESSLYDVERIEVVRGPQGTLHGRNSIGGVVNYITKSPTPNFEAEFVGGFGVHNLEEYFGYVSGPVIENVLSARLMGAKRRQAGDRPSRAVPGATPVSDTGGIDDQNIALTLEYTPTDSLVVSLRANARDVDEVRRAELHIGEGNGDRRIRSTAVCFPLGVDCYFESAIGASDLPTHNSGANRLIPISGNGFGENLDNEAWLDYKPSRQVEHYSVGIDVQWSFGYDQFALRYVGGYSDFDWYQDAPWSAPGGRNSCAPPFCTIGPNAEQFREDHFEVDVNHYNYSHELQLISNLDGPFNFVSGVFTYRANTSHEYRWRDPALFGAYTRTPSYGLIGEIFGPPIYPVRHGFRNGDIGLGTYDAVSDGTYLWTFTDLDNRALAFYSQMNFDLSEQVRLSLGGRWSRDRKDFSDRSWIVAELTAADNFGVPLSVLNTLLTTDPETNETTGEIYRLRGYPFAVQYGVEEKEAWREPIWRVALDWQPADSTLVYGAIATGYRSGGFVGILGNIPDYEKENLVAYELGYKADFLKGRARVNTAAYLYDYRDQQSQTVSPLPCSEPGCEASQPVTERVINVPEARAIGAEIEATISVTPELTVGGHYSYLDTKVTDDFFLSKLGNDLGPEIQADELANTKGFRLVRSPRNKLAVWANYTLLLGDRGSLDFFSSYAYTGDQYQDVFNVRINKMPSFSRWDARISWRSATRKYKVTAWVNNIEDELGITSIETAQNNGRRAVTTAPRIWGLQFQAKFGDGA